MLLSRGNHAQGEALDSCKPVGASKSSPRLDVAYLMEVAMFGMM